MVTGLLTDYVARPLGMGRIDPHFSWRLVSSRRNVRQAFYRILVASSASNLSAGIGDIWDSGRVGSRNSLCIPYEGKTLRSRQQCWWTVQVWDDQGQKSEPAAPAQWEMGLLDPEDWTAQWLAAEDDVSEGDRALPPLWIYGGGGSTTVQMFRRRFRLPMASRSGAFYIDRRHGSRFRSVTIGGHRFEWQRDNVALVDWFELGHLDAGEQAVTLEVEGAGAFDQSICFFARLVLEDGDLVRIRSDAEWKVGSEAAALERTVEIDTKRTRQSWPTAPPINLRCEFALDRAVVRARLYATALGVYEARINGARIGDARLTPEFSQYDRRLLYQTYDVTEALRRGDNVIGLTVADGWYAGDEGRFAFGPPPRRALAQLEILLTDGQRLTIGTDSDWRQAPADILSSQHRIGEVHDHRLTVPGWDAPGFDTSSWSSAKLAGPAEGMLDGQFTPPVRALKELKPLTVRQGKSGALIVDFGENFAGYARVKLLGKQGAEITLRFAEMIDAQGEIDQSSMGIDIGLAGYRDLPKQDVVILRGDRDGEVFEPKFLYRGMRYVEISGLSGPGSLLDVDGIVIGTDLEEVGTLKAESALIQDIWHAIVRTQRSNFVVFQTDSVGREQRGWLGDTALFFDAAAFNADIAPLTSRRLDDMADAQYADGAFPLIAPSPRGQLGGFALAPTDPSGEALPGTSAGWGEAPIIIAWRAWQRYGDVASIKRHWDSFERFFTFLKNANPDHHWRRGRFIEWGDWLSVGEHARFEERVTPVDVVSDAMWARAAAVMAELAEAVAKPDEAKRYRRMFSKVRDAFIHAHVGGDGTVGNGSQACQIFALAFGLLPADLVTAAAARLAEDIRKRGIALTTGLLSTQFLLDVLADTGNAALSYDLLLRTERPSWGYMLKEGATTIWENWDGASAHLAGSQNQPALGSIGGFLFRRLAGIDPVTPGFGTVRIRPLPDERVEAGGADYHSVRGLISTAWRLGPTGFVLDASLPANCDGEIHLPARPDDRILVNSVEISKSSDVNIVGHGDERIIIACGSGNWRFEALAAP